MPRFFLTALIALAAGLGAFAVTRGLAPTPPPATDFDELTWLREEFGLNPAQAERIAELHAAYRPVCAAHCERIATLRAEFAAAPDSPTVAQDLAAATATCVQASRNHLHEVAAVMDPPQARRYLALVEPKLVDHDHRQPLGLQ